MWRADCELQEVSLKGALVEVRPGLKLQAGDTCSLNSRLDAGNTLTRMDGELAALVAKRDW